MDLDHPTDADPSETAPADSAIPGPDAITRDADPTVTLSQRDQARTESCLLFGLLAVANGLVAADSLTRALGVWAGSKERLLRDVLVEQGHIDEPGVSILDALASKHLEQHHGIAWKSLIALGKSVRFRIDPSEVADSELRIMLAGFVEEPATPKSSSGADGLGPRYEIRRHHARGGLGVVSVAYDGEIHREVAVKEIRDDCAHNSDYRARFLREAEVTGRLEHPGIVPVYGMGFHDDGRPYYIMRFIRGETLKVAISRLHKPEGAGEETGVVEGPDLHALVGRFIDACHALAYAHHRKILHRDIKPINIMLGPFGETLVVDWGLAKSFGGSSSGEYPIEEGTLRPESGSELTPTRVGLTVGTVGYISPEQAGGVNDLGPTSDIYSLGVTLYCLATGHAPFEGASKDEFLGRVVVGDFPRPSKVNPSVPRALEAICLKAMALRPIDRYQSVGELIDDLERWSAGSPVLAYPEPLIDRLARSAKKHRTALAGAAVLLICATIGLAVFAERKREENLKLDAAWRVADIERTDAEANRRSALDSLKKTLREVAGADLTYLARSENVRARMANQLVASYRELYRKNPDDKRVRFDLAQACQLAANIGRSMGKFDKPRELYAESIGLLESLGNWSPEPDDTLIELAVLHDDAGENFRMTGSPKKAEAEYRKGLETLRRPAPRPRRGVAEPRAEARLQIDLAGALSDLGRFDEAKQASGRAIDLLEPLASEPNSNRTDRLLLIYALHSRAATLRLAKDFQGASSRLAEAIQWARELMAAVPDPDTKFALAAVRNEQGNLLLDTNRAGPPTLALEAFQEAHFHLESLSSALPRTIHFQGRLAVTLGGRAACYLAMNKLNEARADSSNARRLLERLNAVIPGHFAHLGELGRTCANLGRIARAEGLPDARDLMLQAVTYHSAALAANPGSPTDNERLKECQGELSKLEERAATQQPRP